MKEVRIPVGMGEVRVLRGPEGMLFCLGLGSCVSVCAYDPVTRVGGMAHIVLPSARGTPGGAPGRYADTGVPHLLQEMVRQGAHLQRLVVKLAGGACISPCGPFRVGEENVEAVRRALALWGLRPAGEDVGGSWGRTVCLYLDTGRVTVSSVLRGSREI